MSDIPQILIAEDDIDDLELTQRALSRFREGLSTKAFQNGAALVEYLESLSRSDPSGAAQPRLLLLDIKMPLMGGLEVLEHLRAQELCVGMPVVIFSSSQEPRDIVRANASHVNSFVRKPGDYARYMEVLRQVAAYWLDTNLSRG
ncbi:MAG: hypothetical protein RLZZ200_1165 [Pseudomonadota bacterium]